MNEFVQYEHHGQLVWAREELRYEYREHCLCYSCKRFIPEDREKNCEIANELYALDVKHGLVTPVYECPVFEVNDDKS